MATLIPRNEAPFSIERIVRATGGALVQPGPALVTGISTDTRTVVPHNAFVALAGVRDGHDFVADAIAKGASCVIVSRDVVVPEGVAIVRVEDTLAALGALGREHRRAWRAPGKTLVAITGSAGKTTTRRAVASILASLGARVHASEGNLNNAIGVPMVLFGLSPEHDVAVIEIGTNSRGEIAHGASVAEPDVAVVTLVAAAHTSGIGTVDDVAVEKGALFRALSASGTAIGNADDPRVVRAIAASPAGTKILYGQSPDAAVRFSDRIADDARAARFRVHAGGEWFEVKTSLLGLAGAYAITAAIAVARAVLPEKAVPKALASAVRDVTAEPGRLSPIELGDGTMLLDDSYNANGASVVSSVAAAAEIAASTSRRLALVLGEMRELGDLSAAEHDRVASAVLAADPSVVITVAGDAKRISDRLAEAGFPAHHVESAALAARLAAELVEAGDLVLVKGSRGVGLEAVTAAIRAAREDRRAQ